MGWLPIALRWAFPGVARRLPFAAFFSVWCGAFVGAPRGGGGGGASALAGLTIEKVGLRVVARNDFLANLEFDKLLDIR